MELARFMDYGGYRVEVLHTGHFPHTAMILLNGAQIEVEVRHLNPLTKEMKNAEHSPN